jgi:predicted P-loop ATPase
MAKTKEADRADSIEQEKAPKKADFKKTTNNEVVEEFLSLKYEFRYNKIKCKPEYRDISINQKHFKPLDKYKLNSINRECNGFNIKTSVNALKELFESDFSPAVNPVQEYFKKLPEWNGEKDHIAELADTVEVVNKSNWKKYLTKWLVAVVANAMTDTGCQNHTCLVLTGGQGKFKTTWLDNLCPKELTQYIFTGKIDPNNKDSLTYIAEFLFINIDDQLRQLNKKDENELKNLITTPSVKYRRPYDPYIQEYPHLASFMASVNGNDFLTDPTGSRRFLPFEVTNIKINEAKKLDMDKIYAQAYKLYKDKFQYYFSDEETKELHENNNAFQVISQEEQLIQEYFTRPETRERATHYLTNALIQEHLEKQTRLRMMPKKIGEALTRLGYEKWQRTENGATKWVYSVIQKTNQEIDEQNKNKDLFITQKAAEELPY